MKRVWYGKVFLYMPKEKWIKKAMERGAIQVKRNPDTGKEMWRPMPRKDLMNRSDVEIVSTFNAEIRGLYNFYRIAENVGGPTQVLLYGAVQHVKDTGRKTQDKRQCCEKALHGRWCVESSL